MVVTNYAKNKLTLFLGGSETAYPTNFIIGDGSGVSLATDTTLVNAVDTQIMTDTTFPTKQKVKYLGDWNSSEMSGTQLRQFGVLNGTAITGSIWSTTSLPALTFDGTNELRIEETWEVY